MEFAVRVGGGSGLSLLFFQFGNLRAGCGVPASSNLDSFFESSRLALPETHDFDLSEGEVDHLPVLTSAMTVIAQGAGRLVGIFVPHLGVVADIDQGDFHQCPFFGGRMREECLSDLLLGEHRSAGMFAIFALDDGFDDFLTSHETSLVFENEKEHER